jgi:hypothetical protein
VAQRVLLVCCLLVLASCSSVCGGSSAGRSPSPAVSGALAADSSCQSESSSHSLNSNTPTSYTITNHTSETLTLFWLNFQGQRVKYFDLAPGAKQSQGTFVTHPWVVADPHGTCLRLFLVTDPATITIG